MREMNLRRLLFHLLIPLRERAQPLVAHGGLVELHPVDPEARAAEAVEDCLEPMFTLSFLFLQSYYFLANFERPVLGCIEAKVCN